ncbi:Aspartate--tRNA ligase, mitochondrial [Cytospora mali]|uniref:Aspartate--tRNA ligase, mitochondrial n=1 Tax=Cytospora mali TaxID=578113 RepID=A0A194UZP1_CYTMA|nr:Aspartate--tRNA ligase, mitochondrial [Valsa mali var. pyri (nom. inval.)]
MRFPSANGLVRSGLRCQRPLTSHISLAGHSFGEPAAGPIARKWAERRINLSLCERQRRSFHDEGVKLADTNGASSKAAKGSPEQFHEFKKYFDFPPQSPAHMFKEGNVVTIHGFISKRRDISSKLSFVDLIVDLGPKFQFKSSWEEKDTPEHHLHKALKQVPSWSSVCLKGRIDKVGPSERNYGPKYPTQIGSYDLTLQEVHELSPFPRDIIISDGAQFPPHARHLQMRFDDVLQDRLQLRQAMTRSAHRFFQEARFQYIETPVLFKSTPEGAREFLVPTRRPGYAYALPQSPQQYKQILMAAGVRGYFQFARCFRDEDLRADRQPEFTQLDLEMSFAKGEDVMKLVETLVWKMYRSIRRNWAVREVNGEHFPVWRDSGKPFTRDYPCLDPETQDRDNTPFPRMSYQEVMSLYGSDKPDLRIPNKIQRVDHILPHSFTSMITYLENPIVEACVFRFDSPARDFVKSLWDNLPKPLRNNPDGQAVPLIIDASKPLSGLSPLGHEAATVLLDGSDPTLSNLGQLEEGDLVIFQARPNKPFEGGSTPLGDLRRHIYAEAVSQGLLPFDQSFRFLWVTGFPLFTPTNDASDPAEGQHGASGFSSTHHPFTAPLTPEDFDLLATDPLKVKADHYDLVVNGVELGGGSRRIHIAAVQEYVFREVLKMSDEGVEHFSHLLEALRVGCPPHAGFAFGWDRLVATLGYTGSVRDVIAFPKI